MKKRVLPTAPGLQSAAGSPAYLTASVNNDNQRTAGREEFAGGGGGSLMGLAPVAVANASSRVVSPE